MATEAEIAQANAKAYVGAKTYARVSLLDFAMAALVSILVSVGMSLFPALLFVGLIVMGILFWYSNEKVGGAGAGSAVAYLLVLSSTIFIGALGGIVALLFFQVVVIGIVGSLLGVVYAFFKLQSAGMI